MRWAYDLANAQPIYRDVPVYDTTSLTEGALLIQGTTTNNAVAIVGAAPYTNVIGLLQEGGITTTGTVALGTFKYGKVIINPLAVYRAQYSLTGDTSNSVAATASSSTAQFTFGTSDDDFDGGYIYVNTGTAIGGLWYIATADTTQFDTLSTMGTAADATSYCTKIPGGYGGPATCATTAKHGFKDLNTAATKLISDENETGCFGLLDAWIEYPGQAMTPIRRSSHNGLTGLNTKLVSFYHDIFPLKHVFLNRIA